MNKLLATSALGLLFLGTGCANEAQRPLASTAASDEDRGPIGKADLVGSCADDDGGDFCGGPSYGNCWCDDLCEQFGDCCSDRAPVCEGEEVEFCTDGHVAAVDVFTAATDGKECKGEELHCVTPDGFACPQFQPLPPDWCPDGRAVPGPSSYITSADGMECEIPSVHCVTNDHGACPQFAPLPPDYCSDGTIEQGENRFISSADGMECQLPSVHCVSNDAAACEEPEEDLCPEGTLIEETFFLDDGVFDCTEAEPHCLTNDGFACPQLQPLPPDFCPDGDVVAGAPSYLQSADGMECEMPSVHCVTRDGFACPQLAPLPPDFCAFGKVMQGQSNFISSSDGMECEMPAVHCVSADSPACE